MAFYLLLEDGTDKLQIEDGTGNLLLESGSLSRKSAYLDFAPLRASKTAYTNGCVEARVHNAGLEVEIVNPHSVVVHNAGLNVEIVYPHSVIVHNAGLTVEYIKVLKMSKYAYLEGTTGTLVRGNSDAYLYGGVAVTSSKPSLVRGGITERGSSIAYTHGATSEVFVGHAYLRGQVYTSSSKSAYSIGMPSSTRPAYLSGTSNIYVTNIATEIETKHAHRQMVSSMGLQIEYHPADKQRISAIALQIEYHKFSKLTKPVYLEAAYPPGVAWDFRVAYIASNAISSSSKPAHLYGAINASDSTPAFVHAWDPASDSVSVYISTNAVQSSTKHALVHSGTTSFDGTSAYLAGATNRNIHSAYLEGRGSPRVTAAGVMVETYSSDKLRITQAGIQVETYSSPFIRITQAGVQIEWEVSTPPFGPDAWII